MTVNASQFKDLLRKRKSVLVITHNSPDGDAIASLLSAAEILRSMGSEPTCVVDGEIPSRFRFLDADNSIWNCASAEGKLWSDVLIVDAANEKRIGEAARLINPDASIVNIDHHEDNTRFGTLDIICPDAASTTEILFDIANALGIIINERLATFLYTGLLTDTGGFRFSNTKARTFEIAADLVGKGAAPNVIYRRIFSSNAASSMRLLGEALTSLQFEADGRIGIMEIHPRNDDEELEELSEYALKINGIKASALFRIKDGITRVSLRGREEVNIADVARYFGGGGHPKAAGFTSDQDYVSVRSEVIERLIQEIEKYNADPGKEG